VGKRQGPCTTTAAHGCLAEEWNLLFPAKPVLLLLQKWEVREGREDHTVLLLQSFTQETVAASGNTYKIKGDLVIREGIFRIINCCSCPSYLQ